MKVELIITPSLEIMMEYTNKKGKKKHYYGDHVMETLIRMNRQKTIRRMIKLKKYIETLYISKK